MIQYIWCTCCAKYVLNNVDPLYCEDCGTLLRANGNQAVVSGDARPSPEPAIEPSPATPGRTLDDVDHDIERLRVSFNDLVGSLIELNQAEQVRLRAEVRIIRHRLDRLEKGGQK